MDRGFQTRRPGVRHGFHTSVNFNSVAIEDPFNVPSLITISKVEIQMSAPSTSKGSCDVKYCRLRYEYFTRDQLYTPQALLFVIIINLHEAREWSSGCMLFALLWLWKDHSYIMRDWEEEKNPNKDVMHSLSILIIANYNAISANRQRPYGKHQGSVFQ